MKCLLEFLSLLFWDKEGVKIITKNFLYMLLYTYGKIKFYIIYFHELKNLNFCCVDI